MAGIRHADGTNGSFGQGRSRSGASMKQIHTDHISGKAFRPPVLRCAAAAFVLLPLAACAVGPDFHKPAAPAVSDYQATPAKTTTATPDVPGGAAQTFTRGKDLAADWWTLFHSQALNKLV